MPFFDKNQPQKAQKTIDINQCSINKLKESDKLNYLYQQKQIEYGRV